MANSLDAAALVSIAKNRGRLMKLADGIKTRKKPGCKKSLNLKLDPAYTNIEHLVFGTYRPRSSTPVCTDRVSDNTRTHERQSRHLNDRSEESSMRSDDCRRADALGNASSSPSKTPLLPHTCECEQHNPHRQQFPRDVASPPCFSDATATLNHHPLHDLTHASDAVSRQILPCTASAAPTYLTQSTEKDNKSSCELNNTIVALQSVIPRCREKIQFVDSALGTMDDTSTSHTCVCVDPATALTKCSSPSLHDGIAGEEGRELGSAAVHDMNAGDMASINDFLPNSDMQAGRIMPDGNNCEIKRSCERDKTKEGMQDSSEMVNNECPCGSDNSLRNIDMRANEYPRRSVLKTLNCGVFVYEEEDSCYGHTFGIIGGRTPNDQETVLQMKADENEIPDHKPDIVNSVPEMMYQSKTEPIAKGTTVQNSEKFLEVSNINPKAEDIQSKESTEAQLPKRACDMFSDTSARRASTGFSGAKIERQQAFRRQNTFPSSIPKPRIHYKPGPPQGGDGSSCRTKGDLQSGDSLNEVGMTGSKKASSHGCEESSTGAVSTTATPFRKIASLSEKAGVSRMMTMNMPVIHNLSLQKVKAKTGIKVEDSGASNQCFKSGLSSCNRRNVSLDNSSASSKTDNTFDLKHCVSGRLSARGASCARGHSPRSSTPVSRSNLTPLSRHRSSSRSSVASRSSLSGSRTNLTSAKATDINLGTVSNRKGPLTASTVSDSKLSKSHNSMKDQQNKPRISSGDSYSNGKISNGRRTEKYKLEDFSYKFSSERDCNPLSSPEQKAISMDVLRSHRTTRIPSSKSYANLQKVKSTTGEERSRIPGACGKPFKLIRQSSMYNIPVSGSKISPLIEGSLGHKIASNGNFIPTQGFGCRASDDLTFTTSRMAESNNCVPNHLPECNKNGVTNSNEFNSNVSVAQEQLNNESVAARTESLIVRKEEAQDIRLRRWSVDRSASEKSDVSIQVPRKYSLDDQLKNCNDSSAGHSFDQQWALQHLELSSPKKDQDDLPPPEYLSPPPGFTDDDFTNKNDEMYSVPADSDLEYEPPLTKLSRHNDSDLQLVTVESPGAEERCKHGYHSEMKTLEAIECLVREQTAATTELCKSWMSDIEEKDENSSSGTSRAPSEEPPESGRSPSKILTDVFILKNTGTPSLVEERSRISTQKAKKFAQRSDSLGLERLLPIGPPINRRNFIEDERNTNHQRTDVIGDDGTTRIQDDAESTKSKDCDQTRQGKADPSEEETQLLMLTSACEAHIENDAMGMVTRTDNANHMHVMPTTLPSAKAVSPSPHPLLTCDEAYVKEQQPLCLPSLRLVQNRPISRSERHLKATSTPEFSTTETDGEMRLLHRPWSHVYSETEAQRLLQCSSPSSGSLPSFNRIRSDSSEGSQSFLSSGEQTPINADVVEPMIRCSSMRGSNPRTSISDSMLQMFRKSFSLRFRSNKSDHHAVPAKITDVGIVSESKTNSHRNSNGIENLNASCLSKIGVRENHMAVHDAEDGGSKDGVFRLGSIVLRSSKERKHTRWLKSHGEGESKFNSADSGIQIEAVCPRDEQSSESPALVRRRAASASEPSRQSLRPLSDLGGSHSLAEALEQTGLSSRERGHLEARRTLSDTGCSDLLHRLRKTPSIDRQVSTPPPIKLRSDRAKPQVRRHKGRTRLRRSISQPVDIDKLGLTQQTRISDLHQGGLSDREASVEGSTTSSDEEFFSDGEGYHNFTSPTKAVFKQMYEEGVMYGEALWDHVTLDPEELAFRAGEVVEITDSCDRDWWWGSVGERSGWFPSSFVRLRVNQEDTVEDCVSKMADGTLTKQMSKKISVSLLSNEQVRANVVKEIVTTERDFVQHLKDVVEGYLKQVRRRPDMFTEERVSTIFGNIEQIYAFQSCFLEHLESCIDWDQPHLSQIGSCFLEHEEDFKIYSEYCNNHPLAVSELQELFSDPKFLHFFEACRLLREMIDISLDGFLLTPVQKICKYPLQLAELLKYTKADHPDHEPVANALAAMRRVAHLVNERKRRMECLEQIADWQRTVDGWEGPDLLNTSSVLIHSGDVTRVTSTWSRDLSLFLFDHVLVYCKKDLLKRTHTVYKGRIDLDSCHIYDIEDGKDLQFGVTVRNCWKMYCTHRDKWFMFYTKTPQEKERWLKAFKEERQQVQDDARQGFTVTDQAKRAARLAVLNRMKPKRTRAKFPKGIKPHPDTAVVEILLDADPGPKSRSGSLPSNFNPRLAVATGSCYRPSPPKKKGSGWFHFGSGKKPKK